MTHPGEEHTTAVHGAIEAENFLCPGDPEVMPDGGAASRRARRARLVWVLCGKETLVPMPNARHLLCKLAEQLGTHNRLAAGGIDDGDRVLLPARHSRSGIR